MLSFWKESKMSLTVSLVVTVALSFPSPMATLDAHALTFHERSPDFPEITYGTIVIYRGGKFICGRAKPKDGAPGSMRFIIAMEMDWQFWEPFMDDEAWGGWETAYTDICKGVAD